MDKVGLKLGWLVKWTLLVGMTSSVSGCGSAASDDAAIVGDDLLSAKVDFGADLQNANPDLSATSPVDGSNLPDLGPVPDSASSGDMTSGDMTAAIVPLPTGFPEMPVAPAPTGSLRKVGADKFYHTPCEALISADDGDTIEIDAGSYPGDTCFVSANQLTIRAVGGKAVLDITGVQPYGCGGVWVIAGDNIFIENIEFIGAHVRATDPWVMNHTCAAMNNGAGVRERGTNLILRNCNFHDNDNGVLCDANGASSVLIEYSQFRDNGVDANSHNVYVNDLQQLTFRYNLSSHTHSEGNLLHSRARLNFILYNRLSGEDGPDAFEASFPNGGETYLVGNIIEQGVNTANPVLLDYGSEGITANHDNHLYVVNNTFFSSSLNSATFLKTTIGSVCLARNNLFSGAGTVSSQPLDPSSAGNLSDAQGTENYADPLKYDFHLLAGSAAIGAASAPGMANGYSLSPVNQYVHPASAVPRPVEAKLTVGAYAGP